MDNQRLQICRNIDGIGKNALDSIADDPFFTYGYFKTLENIGTKDSPKIEPFYLSVLHGDKINAVAPCYIELFNHHPSAANRIKKAIFAIGDRAGFFPAQLLNCYSPNSFHSKILRNDNNLKDLDVILKGIDDFCKQQGIPFSSFRYVSEFDNPLINKLENFGYQRLSTAETLYLDVQWNNFDDYLKERAKKIRDNIKREIKKCRESGIIILEQSEFEKISEQLYDFHTNLFSKYNNGAKSPYSVSFFQSLNQHAKDKTKLLTAIKDGKLVGFSLLLLHKSQLDVYFCGFDYESLGNTDFIYFNLVYYEPIKLAIKLGIKRIHFRLAAEDVKLKRGCKREKTYWFIKSQKPLLKPILNLALKMR